MARTRVLNVAELPAGTMKTVHAGETEILLIHHDGSLVAVQAKCPHAGAPLEQGAVCNGRLVCPWHMGTFALPGGELLEPPPLASLKTYAVEIEGDGIVVETEPLPARQPAARPSQTERVIMLAGAGAAGVAAATTLQQAGFDGRIVVVDPVAGEPVDRTQLSKQALSGQMPLEKLPLDALDSLPGSRPNTRKVERITASVVSLSAARSTARLSNGEEVHFESALVATGGTPKRLGVPGAERAHTIRHVDDVRRILAAAEGKHAAAIIGTSFIGLEAASALVQKGLAVTVIGKQELPFAKKFGEQVAQAVQALHVSKGTRFRLGVEVAAITADGVTVHAGGVEEMIPAELVIMGVGVEPELGFEHDLPLAPEGGGVRTDATLRAAGSVWVAGDIANVDGTRIEHWRLAEQHGRVAALAMLEPAAGTGMGHQVRYQGVPFFWTFHFGKRLGYLGQAKEWDEIVTDGQVEELDFLSFYVKDGLVKAFLSCGRDTQTAALAERMRASLTVAEAREAVAAG